MSSTILIGSALISYPKEDFMIIKNKKTNQIITMTNKKSVEMYINDPDFEVVKFESDWEKELVKKSVLSWFCSTICQITKISSSLYSLQSQYYKDSLEFIKKCIFYGVEIDKQIIDNLLEKENLNLSQQTESYNKNQETAKQKIQNIKFLFPVANPDFVFVFHLSKNYFLINLAFFYF